jgi:hypothetical protein
MYLCLGTDGYRFLPDPIKLIEKLGNNSIEKKSDLEDKYISYCDYAKRYSDYVANEYCSASVAARNRSSYNCVAAVNTLYSITGNKEFYMDLWC